MVRKAFGIWHLAFGVWHLVLGQNLVPNNSFEVYNNCPNSNGEINEAPPWNDLIGIGGGSPDYFHACDSVFKFYSVPLNKWGYQQAKEGNAYIGLSTYHRDALYREYIQVELTNALKAGETYCGVFYISMADSVRYATDEIGLYFSVPEISSTTSDNLPYLPQIRNAKGNILIDSINWVKISGIYTAAGGEKHIVIGNFEDDVNTGVIDFGNNLIASYYYIDDVSVTLIQAVDAGPSTTICPGDSAAIGPAVEDVADYSWSPATSLSDPAYYRPTASPSVTTTYILTKATPCDTTTDSVTVFVNNCNPPDTALFIPNTITPNGDGANDTWVIGGLSQYPGHWIKVFNRNGNLLWQTGSYDNTWDGTVEGKELPAGVYFYIFMKGDGSEALRGTISIIR